jgi:DNA/RNA endonuclease G (NUC1)
MRLVSKTAAIAAGILVALIHDSGFAEEGLRNCADSFPAGSVQNAPKRKRASTQGETVRLCERSGRTSFFALEYDPDKYAPLWVSTKFADTFGANGCASVTRMQMGCYFKQKNVASCVKAKAGGDPFHADETLAELDVPRLGVSAFSGTSHDRGHMAPNSAFGWHVCGAYKSFTMANMAAQWKDLNQQLWAQLEAQALYWGVKGGPVYVITGPIWSRFPAGKFKKAWGGKVSMASVPGPGALLKKTSGAKLPLKIVRPTGFYKIIYKPAGGGEPAKAIGFLVPHTKQKKLSFWRFVSSIDLIEDSSGLTFPLAGVSKSGWPELAYWQAEEREAPSKWSPGSECAEKGEAAGWQEQLSVEDRIAACAAN